MGAGPYDDKEITVSVTLSRSEHEISNGAEQQDHRGSGTALEGWFSTGRQNMGCSFVSAKVGTAANPKTCVQVQSKKHV